MSTAMQRVEAALDRIETASLRLKSERHGESVLQQKHDALKTEVNSAMVDLERLIASLTDGKP
jgi:vacuolar-type H+-ATPase subunit D/Vma8